MAKLPRLKRRLLQQAVDENVALIRGRRTERRRPGRRLPHLSGLALLPLAIFVSTFVVAGGRRPPTSPATTTPAPAAATQLGAESLLTEAALAERLRFGVPQAIDRGVFPLAVRKVVIDPGHGGDHTGTVSGRLKEKDLTLDIARRLRDLLARDAYEVELTRDGDDTVSLEDRVALANRVGGDLFVSIHVNWIADRRTRGVETYYLGPTDDPYLKQLAGTENRDSGYSLADFRRLLEGVYVEVRGDESRQLAEGVQTALHRSLRKVNPRLENRGVKTAPFVVLIGTEMPAILAEVSCLSNREEAERLHKPRYRQFIAEALADGIRSYATSLHRIAEKGIEDHEL